MNAPPSGWFPDPLGRHEHRWFNGTTWTSDVSDHGVRYVDPLGVSPSPAGSSGGGGRNGLATAAMVCGILAILVAWAPFIVVVGIVLGVLALVFGIRAMRIAGPDGEGRGRAIAGVVTGSVALALSVVGVVLSVVLFRAVDDFLEPGPYESEVDDCIVDRRVATVDGTLTNQSDVERDYTIFVSVGRRETVITVGDVAAGATVRWDADVQRVDVPSPCSATVVVRGPFPFGIELDRNAR